QRVAEIAEGPWRSVDLRLERCDVGEIVGGERTPQDARRRRFGKRRHAVRGACPRCVRRSSARCGAGHTTAALRWAQRLARLSKLRARARRWRAQSAAYRRTRAQLRYALQALDM